LRVKEIVVAINKMDLVDYSEEVYNKIKADFQALNASTFKEQNLSYILGCNKRRKCCENQQICLGMMGYF
jgi:sulfate adenylyltransferase subunit 1 (EFTu-like GTPase family)